MPIYTNGGARVSYLRQTIPKTNPILSALVWRLTPNSYLYFPQLVASLATRYDAFGRTHVACRHSFVLVVPTLYVLLFCVSSLIKVVAPFFFIGKLAGTGTSPGFKFDPTYLSPLSYRHGYRYVPPFVSTMIRYWWYIPNRIVQYSNTHKLALVESQLRQSRLKELEGRRFHVLHLDTLISQYYRSMSQEVESSVDMMLDVELLPKMSRREEEMAGIPWVEKYRPQR